jgi:hypothetical protein
MATPHMDIFAVTGSYRYAPDVVDLAAVGG